MRRWHGTVLRQASQSCVHRLYHALHALPRSETIRQRRTLQAAANAEQLSVPTPLCLRPAIHEASVKDVQFWRNQQATAIAAVGDALLTADGGPSANDLLRELDWVLDDTVTAYDALGKSNGRPDMDGSVQRSNWQPMDWKQLSAELDHAARNGKDTSTWRLLCRASPQELHDLWTQRLQLRVPFQYLIHTAHWYTYVLSVGPGILVPRPETEIFVDFASQALSKRPSLAHSPWLDLGTGSGAIAIAAADVLRRHHTAAHVWAVDFSATAVAYARHNAQLVGLQQHVSVVQGSWYEPVQHLKGTLGAVLSNPPYIPKEQMAGLQAEVGQHEPWSALDGGDGGGLDSLQVICAGAAEMLVPGGFIALETAGNAQAEGVAELLRQQGGGGVFEEVEVVQDCYGVPRFVTGYKVCC